MKEFTEFTSLANAQAYEYTTYKKITSGQASKYFGLSGMLDALKARQDDATVIELSPTLITTVGQVCVTVLNSATTTGFAADPSENDGADNRLAAQILLAYEVFPSQIVIDNFWSISESKVKPYEFKTQVDWDEAHDEGEVIALPSVHTQHKVTFAIATQPRKPVRIIIEQQFGSEGDLTEWHEVGSVTVNYTQRHYESGLIAAKPAGVTIRNLRAVSPLTLELVAV